ncbi:MAG TPA: hypothetical protein VK540_20075 [Polyangiaceae bacterium]|nr:hypothetical protein [Polyangiaceae bacterium]
MRHREGRLTLVLLIAAAACGPEFTVRGGSDSGATADGSSEEAGVPPVAEGLVLWLRADVGVTEASGAISNWADQSGNHLDARQFNTDLQPTWAAAGLSGRPTVMFRADDVLSLPSGFADFSRGISLFAVTSLTDVEPCMGLVHLSNGPEIDDIELGRYNERGTYEVLEGVLSGADFPLGRAQLISVVHEPDRTAAMRFNGSETTTAQLDLPRMVTRRSNLVGRSQYANCGSVHGSLAEMLIYRRALDDAERGQVESQLQSRWGCCR